MIQLIDGFSAAQEKRALGKGQDKDRQQFGGLELSVNIRLLASKTIVLMWFLLVHVVFHVFLVFMSIQQLFTASHLNVDFGAAC